jgi:DNA-binding XRE family transcriptional regulator
LLWAERNYSEHSNEKGVIFSTRIVVYVSAHDCKVIVSKGEPVKKLNGFDVKAYQERLRLLREIVSGENQMDFAKRLGVPFKRWSNYERGYPVPRETAFLLCQKFPGLSVEWIWWGWTGNLSKNYADRIALAEKAHLEVVARQAEYDKATLRLQAAKDRRKRVSRPRP